MHHARTCNSSRILAYCETPQGYLHTLEGVPSRTLLSWMCYNITNFRERYNLYERYHSRWAYTLLLEMLGKKGWVNCLIPTYGCTIVQLHVVYYPKPQPHVIEFIHPELLLSPRCKVTIPVEILTSVERWS
jgi:hypothetical protein